MFNPFTFMLSAVGAGVEFGAEEDQRMQTAMALVQEAKYSDKAYDQNIKAINEQHGYDAVKLRMMFRKSVGTARSQYGASGVTMEGSPTEVMGEAFANMEQDTQMLERNRANKTAMLKSEKEFRSSQLRTKASDVLSGRLDRIISKSLGVAGKGLSEMPR